MVDDNKITQQKNIRSLWLFHASLGFAIMCLGMLRNGGGRKYIPIIPESASMGHCQNVYANVHASSQDEPGALLCCDGSQIGWNIFSYEDLLCSQKMRPLPFVKSLTKFPDSWLLPLLPIFLRLVIAAFGWITNASDVYQHGVWPSISRLIFYILIMQFRAWGLYVFMDNSENYLLQKTASLEVTWDSPFIPSVIKSFTPTEGDETCWYTEFLRKTTTTDKAISSCYGQQFDFSDHIVFFFAHLNPALLFEAVIFILYPLWPKKTNSKEETTRRTNTPRRTSSWCQMVDSCMSILLNRVLTPCLLVIFIYLNFITLLAVHSTATHFHTLGEVVVGYLISLTVQIPLGIIVCSSRWTYIRRVLGLPLFLEESKDGNHVD